MTHKEKAEPKKRKSVSVKSVETAGDAAGADKATPKKAPRKAPVKRVAKKAPAKKAAPKKTTKVAKEESTPTPLLDMITDVASDVVAVEEVVLQEVEAIVEPILEPVKSEEKVVKAEPKEKTTVKATKAATKAEKKVESDVKSASKKAEKKATKKTTKKATKKAALTPAEIEAAAAMASRVQLAKKSADENNAQINLSARSKADAAIAAKNYSKPKPFAGSHQTAAQVKARVATIAQEAQEGAKVFRGIEAIPGEDYADTVKAAQTNAALDSRAALAAKAFGHTTAQVNLSARSKAAIAQYIQESSHQDAAQVEAGVNTNQVEAEVGAQVAEAIAEVKGTPYTKVAPAMASRIELAKKSAAENNAQVNLSARSKEAAAKEAKNYKKPAPKKAAPKTAQDQIISDIMKEAKNGSRIKNLIAEVPGVAYDKVLQEVKEKAAMESRKALATRKKTTLSQKTPMTTEEENKFYDTLDDQTLVDMLNALGVHITYDTLKSDLEKSPDVDSQVDKYLKQVTKEGRDYTFEKDGFDTKVIPYFCNKVAATLPSKTVDNISLAKKITNDVPRMLINNSANDTAIYNDLFDDMRKILVHAQQNQLHSLEEVERDIPADLEKLVDRFMTVAYTILPGWQYNDVKYYEGFLYSVMAQFDDLASWQNRALMDIADLYIKHGDYQRGNDGYGYVLRENQLKDQIYYRFAKVYEPFDLQRAKGIAQDALRIVDGRYTYYPKIIEILQK